MSQVGAEGFALHGYSASQILAHYYTGTSIGHVAAGRLVTVLLRSGLRNVVFGDADRAGPRPLDEHSTYIAHAAGAGRIALESARGRVLARLAAPLLLTSAVPIAFDGQASSGVVNGRYRGSIQLVESGGRLGVINRVGLEDYVRGVVPVESPPSWQPAELQAQAIAARSFAVANPPQHGFDFYADTRSQQYGGYDAEAASTDAAVDATAGEVVTFQGEPVPTFYFASSGGETESVQNAFVGSNPEPYLTAVLDPYDTSRFGPITLSLAQADRRLRGIVRGTLRSIVVTHRGISPRVVSAQVVGTRGTTTVNGTELADALGLQSTWDCFAMTTDSARLAADWAHACARPSSLGATGATGPTGGGTLAGSGPTGSSGVGGATGSSGAGGGAVGPSG